MNANKVAFIICSNDENILAEAEYYIDRLILPENITAEKIFIRGAASMTGGYNLGMSKSDAKYKLYLHQDVFLINKNIISDIIGLFTAHPELGILGVVGAVSHIASGNYLEAWDFGAVSSMLSITPPDGSLCGSDYREAVALDGLFLATQYDIRWREDIFTGWDFYDISQCFEFTRAGYHIGIVNQHPDAQWCHHDTEGLSLIDYYHFRNVLTREYTDIYDFNDAEISSEEAQRIEWHRMMNELYGAIENLIDREQNYDAAIAILCENYRNIMNHRALCALKRVAVLCREEQRSLGSSYFLKAGDSTSGLIHRLNRIRYAIERIEFNDDASLMGDMLRGAELTETALALCSIFYAQNRERYLDALSEIYGASGLSEEFSSVQDKISAYSDSYS